MRISPYLSFPLPGLVNGFFLVNQMCFNTLKEKTKNYFLWSMDGKI